MGKHPSIDFIGIGAQKTGTSWLFRQLEQLSEFGLPEKKEIHYFDRDPKYPSYSKLYNNSLTNRMFDSAYWIPAVRQIMSNIKQGNYRKSKFLFKWYFGIYGDNWYISLFKHLQGFKGEITPSYSMLEANDVKKMYELAPNAKLIFLMRDPIDRAWSQYRFQTRKQERFSIESTLEEDRIIKFMNTNSQELRSDYQRTISNYLQVYPKNQLLLGFYDAIRDTPDQLIKEIVQYITGNDEVDTAVLDLGKQVNVSRKIEIPENVKSFMLDKFHDQMKHLAETYGGYCYKWYSNHYDASSLDANEVLKPTLQLH